MPIISELRRASSRHRSVEPARRPERERDPCFGGRRGAPPRRGSGRRPRSRPRRSNGRPSASLDVKPGSLGRPGRDGRGSWGTRPPMPYGAISARRSSAIAIASRAWQQWRARHGAPDLHPEQPDRGSRRTVQRDSGPVSTSGHPAEPAPRAPRRAHPHRTRAIALLRPSRRSRTTRPLPPRTVQPALVGTWPAPPSEAASVAAAPRSSSMSPAAAHAARQRQLGLGEQLQQRGNRARQADSTTRPAIARTSAIGARSSPSEVPSQRADRVVAAPCADVLGGQLAGRRARCRRASGR